MNYDGKFEYWAAEERLAIGQKYKDLMPPSMQEQVFNRNLNIKNYPSKYGPDADWLRTNKGLSDAQIIKSAGRPDGGDIIGDLLDYFDDIWK